MDLIRICLDAEPKRKRNAPKMIGKLLVFAAFARVTTAIECYLQESSTVRDLPDGCTVIRGYLSLRTQTDYSLVSSKLRTVVSVIGNIYVGYLDYRNLSFFESLQSVYYEPPNAHAIPYAFLISYMPNLERLMMPKLVNVTVQVVPTNVTYYSISLHDTPRLCFTEEDMNMIYSIDRSFGKTGSICSGIATTKVICTSVLYNISSLPFGCQIIDSGLWITGNETAETYVEFSRKIETIEKIYGPIVIFNSAIEQLHFPNLVAIINPLYENSDWGTYMIYINGNPRLTSVSLPKLKEFRHFGWKPHISLDRNTQLVYTADNCKIWKQMYKFQLQDSNACGHLPELVIKGSTWPAVLQFGEAFLCAFANFSAYAYFIYQIYQRRHELSFFQYSILLMCALAVAEMTFACTNLIEIFDDLHFPKQFGIFVWLYGADSDTLLLLVNSTFTIRMSLLLACCFYRTVVLLKPELNRPTLILALFVVICMNFLNIDRFYAVQRPTTFPAYEMCWTCLAVSSLSTAVLIAYFRKSAAFSQHEHIRIHQNQLSFALFKQAFASALFCGFPVNLFTSTDIFPSSFVFWRTEFGYRYDAVICRWYYFLLVICLTSSIEGLMQGMPSEKRITRIMSRHPST